MAQIEYEKYRLTIYIDGDCKRRLRKVEDWCQSTHRCILKIKEVKQMTDKPGRTSLIINTWEEKFGFLVNEFSVGPMYREGDYYKDVDPIKCRNSINFIVEGPNILKITCTFKQIE